MHAAYAGTTAALDDAVRYDHVPSRRVTRPLDIASISIPAPARTAYGEARGTNWIAILTVAAFHILGLAALISFDIVDIGPAKKKPPLVIELLRLPEPPPPAATAPASEPKPVPPRDAPVVVAPAPVVKIAQQTPPPVAAVAEPPAPRAAIVARPAPAAPTGPVSVTDLSSKMIAGKPPKYPVESRRKREQGTVVLTILVGIDGGVADAGISRSSGFARLDKAALDAVRRWRWSPTIHGGQPVMVRGYVDIPFVLNG